MHLISNYVLYIYIIHEIIYRRDITHTLLICLCSAQTVGKSAGTQCNIDSRMPWPGALCTAWQIWCTTGTRWYALHVMHFVSVVVYIHRYKSGVCAEALQSLMPDTMTHSIQLSDGLTYGSLACTQIKPVIVVNMITQQSLNERGTRERGSERRRQEESKKQNEPALLESATECNNHQQYTRANVRARWLWCLSWITMQCSRVYNVMHGICLPVCLSVCSHAFHCSDIAVVVSCSRWCRCDEYEFFARLIPGVQLENHKGNIYVLPIQQVDESHGDAFKQATEVRSTK